MDIQGSTIITVKESKRVLFQNRVYPLSVAFSAERGSRSLEAKLTQQYKTRKMGISQILFEEQQMLTLGENFEIVLDDQFREQNYPFLKKVVANWEGLAPYFIRKILPDSIAAEQSLSAYEVDGIGKIQFPEELAPAPSKTEKLVITHGEPFETTLPSEGCKYIAGIPWEQHYTDGRFDYLLCHDNLTMAEKNKGSKFSFDQQTAAIALEILEFISIHHLRALKELQCHNAQ